MAAAVAVQTLIDSSVPSSNSRPLATGWSEAARAGANAVQVEWRPFLTGGGGVTESHG